MAGPNDLAVALWDEIEDAEAAVDAAAGNNNPAASNARQELDRIRKQVRPGGVYTGDIHTIARARTTVADIVAAVS